MKKILLIFVLLLFSTNAFAFPGYQWYNFSDNPNSIFDHNNNWCPISYPYVGNLPSPGYYYPGGEHYDIEGLNVAVDEDYIHISLTNSFGYETNEGFRLGDLFIGVDGGDKYAYAVDMQSGGANGGLWEVNNSWNEIQDRDDTYYSYDDIRTAAGAHEIDQSRTSLARRLDGTVMSTWSNGDWESNPLPNYSKNTYVWELRIDKSLINNGNFGSLSFHVNLGCGNDLLEEKYSAVPEPATVVLFGLGLLGTAYYRRRKR